jgi:Tn3 transposase DDE domain
LRNRDDLLRVAGSLLIGKLQTYARKNRLTRALQEYGRLIKTIFILRSSASLLNNRLSEDDYFLLRCCYRNPSTCGVGDCYDNSVVESFFTTLKHELVHYATYKTHEETKRSLFETLKSATVASVSIRRWDIAVPRSSRIPSHRQSRAYFSEKVTSLSLQSTFNDFGAPP